MSNVTQEPVKKEWFEDLQSVLKVLDPSIEFLWWSQEVEFGQSLELAFYTKNEKALSNIAYLCTQEGGTLEVRPRIPATPIREETTPVFVIKTGAKANVALTEILYLTRMLNATLWCDETAAKYPLWSYNSVQPGDRVRQTAHPETVYEYLGLEIQPDRIGRPILKAVERTDGGTLLEQTVVIPHETFYKEWELVSTGGSTSHE